MTTDESRDTDRTFRSAATFTLSVFGAALLTMLVALVWMSTQSGDCTDSMMECAGDEKYLLVFGPPLVLLLGGVTAFVRTYQVWRAGGRWFVWQGAGWLLFVLMMIYAAASSRALLDV